MHPEKNGSVSVNPEKTGSVSVNTEKTGLESKKIQRKLDPYP